MSSLYDQLSKEGQKKEDSSIRQKEKSGSGLVGIKVSLFGAFLLSLAALGGAGYLYQSLNAEKREREALEASQVQFQEMTQTLRAESDQYRTEMERMRGQLKTYSAEREELKSALDQNGLEIASLQNKLKEMAEQTQGQAPAESLAQSSTDQTGSVQVVPPAPKTPKVMTVNRKFNFAIINLGMRDNVKIGDRFSVQKDGKIISNLQVEKLYDDFAAATIVEEEKDAPIAEGDLVLTA